MGVRFPLNRLQFASWGGMKIVEAGEDGATSDGVDGISVMVRGEGGASTSSLPPQLYPAPPSSPQPADGQFSASRYNESF